MRERKGDIPLLVNHFIEINNTNTGKRIQGISQPAMNIFMNYDWPGNVRELENAIEHAFVLCEGSRIDVSELPDEVRRERYDSATFQSYHESKKNIMAGQDAFQRCSVYSSQRM